MASHSSDGVATVDAVQEMSSAGLLLWDRVRSALLDAGSRWIPAAATALRFGSSGNPTAPGYVSSTTPNSSQVSG
jgi:hypothetical protein